MAERTGSPLVAVDIGNNRIKLGLFRSSATPGLPQPRRWWSLAGDATDLNPLAGWLPAADQPLCWWIGSVNRPATTRLVDWLRRHRSEDPVTLLAAGDLPLEVALERPDMVGIDRLLAAVAANRLRHPRRAAVIVDLGTAITVDLVSTEGAFLGGAILPGIAISARALHEFTDLLPEIRMSELQQQPPALGGATEPAMRAGLYWGAVGGVRELIGRLAEEVSAQPEVFLTGGAGEVVARLFGPTARYQPHLTLAGIILAAARSNSQFSCTPDHGDG